jgi:hypothetical protein
MVPWPAESINSPQSRDVKRAPGRRRHLLNQTLVRSYLNSKSGSITACGPWPKERSPGTRCAIGKKHGVSPAQGTLKWLLEQDGVKELPKAQRLESLTANLKALTANLKALTANLKALKLSLDDEDRRAIAAPPKDLQSVSLAFALRSTRRPPELQRNSRHTRCDRRSGPPRLV